MSAGLPSASADGIPELVVEPSQQAALLNLKAKAKRRAVRRIRLAASSDALCSSETLGADSTGARSLVADAMRDCSMKGDIVLDTYLGSGTTVLAAEKTGRRGFAMEYDAAYVDVAVQRWQSYTRADAVLVGDGRTFDEIAAERTEGAWVPGSGTPVGQAAARTPRGAAEPDLEPGPAEGDRRLDQGVADEQGT